VVNWKKVKEYFDFKIIVLSIIFFIVLISFIFYKTYYSITFYSMKEHIAAGIFNSALDIFFLFIIFNLFLNLDEKRREIKRYLEEINDYRNWHEPEASYRIVGLIKRLNRLNVISNIDLRQCYLDKANLQDVKLMKSNLGQTTMIEANLIGAHLEEANLEGANFKKANLSYANLNGSMIAANFKNACLINAQLKRAWLQCTFEKADLSGAHFEEARFHRQVYFDEADLESANFQGAKFDGVYFHKANLKNANFTNAFFTSAELNDSILINADFKNAKDLTWEQLSNVKTLYGVKNLDPEIKKKLQKDFKHLFEKTEEVIKQLDLSPESDIPFQLR